MINMNNVINVEEKNVELFNSNDECNFSVRAAKIDDEDYFVAKDVAACLGYSNPLKAISMHVDECDKGVSKMGTPGGTQSTIFINESGLYSLILSSKLETAKAFKHWITSVVIPNIRKTGGYVPTSETDTEAEIVLRAMNILQKTIDEQHKRIDQQNKQITKILPKAQYADAVLLNDDDFTTTQMAKELNLKSAKWLNADLISRGILFYQTGRYMLTYKYAAKGYTTTRTIMYTDNNNVQRGNTYTIWTEKGRHFLHTIYDSMIK